MYLPVVHESMVHAFYMHITCFTCILMFYMHATCVLHACVPCRHTHTHTHRNEEAIFILM